MGIDVDMDDGPVCFTSSKLQRGSLAFWGNGEYLGVVKDNEAN